MKFRPFSYELPPARIAQRPCYPYHDAKLLRVDRSSNAIADSSFIALPSLLIPGDLLVFNDTRVIPARLFGKKEDTGAAIELLLLKQLESDVWSALVKPRKRVAKGTVISFAHGSALVEQESASSEIVVRLQYSGELSEFLNSDGVMPIPPYIRKGKADADDKRDYQSTFAKKEGSIAAPTASLHFTPELLESLRAANVEIETVTLHVGSASFLPVYNSDAQELGLPGSEYFGISEVQANSILLAKNAGRRVIAVGTTVARALESWSGNTAMYEDLRETDLFIVPGHEWTVCDGLITNFHQPGTTHMLLVEALMGADLLEKSYAHALEADYRFLSYGDGMLIT